MTSKLSLQKGLFFTYINPETGEKIKFNDKTYDKPVLLPNLGGDNIRDVLSHSTSLNLLGITTDQQLYKPGKDVKVLLTALDRPNARVKLIFRRNGTIWCEDETVLSSIGTAIFTLYDVDIGSYDVSATVAGGNTQLSLGTASFEVAVFELDPFQVEILNQSMSSSQKLTSSIMVTILHEPYSGPLKVGLYCSYCQQVVLRDEVNVYEGKAVVSFDVSGHTAPFSLEFIVPDRGYTARIQLEGTMPHQRLPTPISANLSRNYQMSLFPETGSITVQGVNITPAGTSDGALFAASNIVSDTLILEILQDLDHAGISTFDPVSQELGHEIHGKTGKGTEFSLNPGKSHRIFFMAGIKDGELFEAFFTGFRSPDHLPALKAPEKAISGSRIPLVITNPSEEESEAIVMVFDKRKTHSSLYKAIGKHVHGQLKTSLEYLPARLEALFSERRYKGRQVSPRDTEEEMKEESVADDFDKTPAKKQKAKAPPNIYRLMTIGVSAADMDARSRGGRPPPPLQSPAATFAPAIETPSEPDKSPDKSFTELFEDFEEVIYCDRHDIPPKGEITIDVDLADQITTWEVRMYGFQGMLFKETIENISATKERYVQIRAPEIIDVDAGDSAEIEIHYLADTGGTLEVFLDDSPLGDPLKVTAGKGKIPLSLDRKGTLRGVLKAGTITVEAVKEVRAPFEQTLVYTHMVHLHPSDKFLPLQPVMILPNPLPLIRESVHALQGYPFGCAEQTSAKLGALALAYKYHVAIGSGEEQPLRGMITQGLGRLMTEFFDVSGRGFGMWGQSSSDLRTTVQVLKNLVPLISLLPEFHLDDFQKQLGAVVGNLKENGVYSFELLVYDQAFRPDKAIEDPLEAANALLHAVSGINEAKELLRVISDRSACSDEVCSWSSPLAWGGTLQTTAQVLRALARHGDRLTDEQKNLYKKGLANVMNSMINGRLFTTTDTLSLIGLFTELPVTAAVIKESGKQVPITRTTEITNEFEAVSDVYVHWVEEKVASPFTRLPAGTTGIKMSLSAQKMKVGDEVNLVIHAPSEMFCPVVSICLPPNLSMKKGGGNVQQHYLPFRGDKSLLLELVATRKGTGHVKVVIHDMYNMDQAVISDPLEVKIN